MSKLFIKKLSENATTPSRGSSESAGLDLYAAKDYMIYAGTRQLVETNIAIGIPEGYYGRIAPRSGLAFKHGVDVLAGVVDADYIGEIKVILLNTDNKSIFKIDKGDRIAQIVLERITIPEIIEVEDLDDTERSSAGFGSTGI